MRESVQLDLLGEMHFDFDDREFVYVRQGYSSFRLPTWTDERRVAMNEPIRYDEVQWIGSFVQRQWWLLLLGIPFTIFGPIWARAYIGDWGPFAVSMVWFVMLGIFPLLAFARGRIYLGIATADAIVVLPMDRKRRKVVRILGLLRQFCNSPRTEWQLAGTAFEHPESWDARPPTGKAFDQSRYIRITALASLYALANVLYGVPSMRPTARVLWSTVVIAAGLWAVQAIYRRIRR